MLAKCGAGGMEIKQCDIDTAFLYGKIEGEIYMELPEGLRELLELAEAEGDDDDVCVGEEECIVCLYVDDMLIASRQKTVIASVKAGIAEKFRIKDLGKARFILGFEIDCDMERRPLGISQKAYTESTIKNFGKENVKPGLTPLEPGVHFTRADEPQTGDDKVKMKAKPYRSLVGSLIYLACGTRPDISVAIAKLSRFLENPGEKHWDTGIKVVCYLLKTKDVGIVYDGSLGTELEAYSDADWAGNCDDRRSVSGMMLMMCGTPVAWRSTFQKTVALSSTEAEYKALSDCGKECIWMRRLLKDMGGGYSDIRCTRGGSLQATSIDYSMIAASWCDGDVVNMLTNTAPSTTSTVTIMIGSESREYPVPTCLGEYNQNMQGVDRLGQIRGRFSIADGHSFKRWHKKLALAMIDIA
ncbi:unnamed protein product [Phytophthora fragariaefolia]|uniref:Unnamed protein product n=1 Tax=Phytophthora fragariaefolia TaxID=1490495 RepID=A0A9W6XPW8_9STRA|nr:unnamed protein product [Phytophthora fragariaefolia]